MPATQPTLEQGVIDKLGEFLPEFREGDKNKRKTIVTRLTKDTLSEGADGHKHKKVTFY
jgi:hypothetical protein